MGKIKVGKAKKILRKLRREKLDKERDAAYAKLHKKQESRVMNFIADNFVDDDILKEAYGKIQEGMGTKKKVVKKKKLKPKTSSRNVTETNQSFQR